MDNKGNKLEIQFPAAIDEKGHYINVKTLIKETCSGHTYSCPRCNNAMAPVLGEVRVHHFRHLGKICKRDDYLHGCAEAAFMEEYKRCLDEGAPFYIEIPALAWCNQSCVLKDDINCDARNIRTMLDLTSKYRIIKKEERVQTTDDSFRRPDILLQTEDGKASLWIEFCVTHAVDEIKQRTGRIVEIRITSESDIDTIIRGHRIIQSDDKEHWVKLYNIGLTVYKEPMGTTPPCEKFYLFTKHYYSESFKLVSDPPTVDNEKNYQLVLRLNWFGKHDIDKYIDNRKDSSDLYLWCLDRFNKRTPVDESIADLIVWENRHSEIKPTGISFQTENNRRHKDSLNKIQPEITKVLSEYKSVNWIDLGLPSGVLWADVDGRSEEFKDFCMLPSRENVEEIKKYCKQENCGDSLRIIGPNGQSIMLNPAKYRLSSHGKDGGVVILSIFGLLGDNYLHLFDDDISSQHYFRCIRYPNE